ncbi:uncharacterized protein LOC143282187 [Babylonia areolata]|uniref:uncharacterized protein LOC143282187 n=1 Tax=Babylonia areolata TaxID=304850 RepID=UPI003FD1F8D6
MGVFYILNWCRRTLLSVGCSAVHWLQGCLFVLLQRLIFRDPRKRLDELHNRESCVVSGSVVWRWKNNLIEMTTAEDFLVHSQQKLSSLDVLLKPDVSLYCVTPDCVLFVRTSPGVNCYRSETSPFFYMAQFFHAEEVYVTSHHWFHVLAAEIAEDCRVPVTWLSITGRCGSTMLCQVMEGVPGVVCVSEPDAILNIAMLANAYRKTSDCCLSLLQSTIYTLVYHATTAKGCSPSATEHVFIKTRSFCSVLVRDIHKVCPENRHVFMFRRLPQLLRSFKRLLSRGKLTWLTLVNSDTVASLTPFFRHLAFRYLFLGSEEEKAALEDLVPDLNIINIFASMTCSQIRMVQRLQAEGFPIPVLRYEDVVADPVRVVGALFDFIHISRDHLDSALKSMGKRSQSNVPGFEDNTASSTCHLTARDRQGINNILARMQLPKMDEDIEFIETLG